MTIIKSQQDKVHVCHVSTTLKTTQSIDTLPTKGTVVDSVAEYVNRHRFSQKIGGSPVVSYSAHVDKIYILIYLLTAYVTKERRHN